MPSAYVAPAIPPSPPTGDPLFCLNAGVSQNGNPQWYLRKDGQICCRTRGPLDPPLVGWSPRLKHSCFRSVIPGLAPPLLLSGASVVPLELALLFQPGKTALAQDPERDPRGTIRIVNVDELAAMVGEGNGRWFLTGTVSRKEAVPPAQRGQLARRRAALVLDELERRGVDRSRLTTVEREKFLDVRHDLAKDEAPPQLDLSAVLIYGAPPPPERSSGSNGECHPGALVAALIAATDAANQPILGISLCSDHACSGNSFDLRTLPAGGRAAFRLEGELDAGASIEAVSSGLLVLARSTAKEASATVEGRPLSISLFWGPKLHRRLQGSARHTVGPQVPGAPKHCKWAYLGDLPQEEVWKYESR